MLQPSNLSQAYITPWVNRGARALGGASGLAAGFVALVFTIFYAWDLLSRHARYDTYAFDLGLLSQVVWNTLDGRWFATTVMPFNYLAEHFSPALALVSPVFLVWPDERALLVIQAAAAGATGIGVYLVVLRLTGETLPALLLQTAYHLAPGTAWTVRDEFHPITLAMPVLVFATLLLWQGRPRLAVTVAALALLANEDAAMWVAPFGLVAIAIGGRRALVPGLLLCLTAVVWIAAYLFVIVPMVRPPELAGVPHPDIGAFAQCGSDLSAVLRCVVLDPQRTASRLTTVGDWEALLNVFGPTAGLGLLGPSLIAAVPRWLVLLLGGDPPHFRAHYVALLVPAAYLASAEVIGWLRRRGALSARVLAGLVLGFSVVAYVLVSPLPGGRAHEAGSPASQAKVPSIDVAVSLIPRDPEISVAATSSIMPHIALRSRLYLLTEGSQPLPDYRIVDRNDGYPFDTDHFRQLVGQFLADPRYEKIFDRDEIVVLRAVPYHPPHAADALLGGAIRLTGYGMAPEGDNVRIRLYWRLEQRLASDYHFFVHLVDGEGKRFSQKDGTPAAGNLVATEWRPGQEVREDIVIPAPGSDWAGYRVLIGWYDFASGARLKLDDGQDHVAIPMERE